MTKHLICPLLALAWTLGCYKGYLALFRDSAPEPCQIYPCPVENLPETDQLEPVSYTHLTLPTICSV